MRIIKHLGQIPKKIGFFHKLRERRASEGQEIEFLKNEIIVKFLMQIQISRVKIVHNSSFDF